MLKSQKARLDAPEMDSLRLGSGWKTEELELPQIFVAGTYGEGSPGSVHLAKVHCRDTLRFFCRIEEMEKKNRN